MADRTQEHLGESDRGMILLRRRMLEEPAIVAHGEEPKGIVRDSAQNECIMLPMADLELLRNGQPMGEMLKQERFRQASRTPGEFVFFAHQPDAIKQEYRRAMGLDLAHGHRRYLDGRS